MKTFKMIYTLGLVLISNVFAINETYNLNVNESTVSFVSDAPLEVIQASSKALIGAIDTAKKVFSFKLKVSSFEGFNSALQKEHFEENYLEITEFPNTTFSGKIIGAVDFTRNGDYEVRGKGALMLHGVSNERIIKCILNVKNGVCTINSSFIVNLMDHEITIPKLVKQKISNEIAVTLRIVMK